MKDNWDPQGDYVSLSYGWNFKINKNGLEGQVYFDLYGGGEIKSDFYLKTTPCEDLELINYFVKLGTEQPKGSYNIRSNCITFSRGMFEIIKNKGYGQPAKPPVKRSKAWRGETKWILEM